MGGVRALLAVPFEALEARRGRLLPFLAVAMGIGIGVWFALPWEPGWRHDAGMAVAMILCLTLLPSRAAPLGVFGAFVLLGALACGLRVAVVGTPMLERDYYGPVTGRVVEVDRSQSGALRVTLDRVWLSDAQAEDVPRRVRVSLQGDQPGPEPVPGEVVMTTAFLSPPGGAVEPGSFDFRQMAFFEGLGAVGYTRVPLMLWEEAQGEQAVGRLRAYLSAGIRARIEGDAGAFAAGVLTGDRSGLSVAAVAALRDSSLAHLLAISGMNMAILVGFTFGFLRYGLALVPPVALRVNGKKVAAVVSLGVACFYLLLSGANVATERAFIMVAVMLVAVLMDRRALTLRSVAVAGIILLGWQPEALLSPGFQMSFAATVALIAGFAALNGWLAGKQVPWLVRVGGAAVLASVVGGLATAPYAAAHFNRFTDYGLLANLLTGPVMGLVVMPAGALAALGALVGLEGPPLWVMEQGCLWILFVAHEVAALEGAVTALPATSGGVLAVLTLGVLFVVLWSGWVRWLGFVPAVGALVIWAGAERPLMLVSEGGVVGVMGETGRTISAARGEGFTVQNWLENDGDLAPQAEAAGRPGFIDVEGGRLVGFAGRTGFLAEEGTVPPGLCARVDLVVGGQGVGPGPCLWLSDAVLARTGTVAILRDGEGLRVIATETGARVWSPPVTIPALRLP